MSVATLWSTFAGRELDSTPLRNVATVSRVVACLNVWNDYEALLRSIPTWKRFVDHVIVVDGSYDTTGATLSTDGTIGLLRREFGPALQIIDAPGLSQCEKRTKYLDAGQEGDLLVIIDADEHMTNGAALCSLPRCDVGWIRIHSPIYSREYGQPRIIRWRPNLHYKGRHHWIYDGDRLLCTHQYGGPGYEHRPVPLVLTNERNLGRDAHRQEIKRTHLSAQTATEVSQSAMPRSVMSDSKIGAREPLWILNYAYRDDGLAPSRFHTALNRTTPHSSMFFKVRPGPFGVQTQYSATTHRASLATAMQTADVIHIHSVMSMAYPVRSGVPLVFHHHGSLLRANAKKYAAEARRRDALVVLSNLELFSWTDGYPAFFLPNTVPVARYKALADSVRAPWDGNSPFRVGHSPTHRHRKGTQEFLNACERLLLRGYPIEPVLIEDTTHANALALKAACHAMFDSFWLGIQCSGIEAAAMHLPVIAGDEIVAQRYRDRFGSVPYTFAPDGETLEATLKRLMEDSAFRQAEADRVHSYIVENHDESAVALTYLDYLDQKFSWRSWPRSRPSSPASRRIISRIK